MKNKIKVTVITSTYNGEKYIQNAINSVLKQSLKDFEYIIVNDCSKDNTLKICESFARKDNRIKIINNNKNMERSRSRNNAAKSAKGKFLAFIDDDDIREDSDKLKKQVGFMEQYKEYCLVGTNFKIIDENLKEKDKKLVFRETDKEIRENFLKTNSFIFSSVLVRKICFIGVGGFDEGQFLAEDYELWLKIGKKGKLYNLNDKCVLYMDRYNNTSNKRKNKLKINYKGLKFCLKYRKDYPNFVINLISKTISLIIPSKLYELKEKIKSFFSKIL